MTQCRRLIYLGFGESVSDSEILLQNRERWFEFDSFVTEVSILPWICVFYAEIVYYIAELHISP